VALWLGTEAIAHTGKGSASESMFSIPKNPPHSTQTPHSGYHWDGSSRRFAEGWYLRDFARCGQTFFHVLD